MTAKRASVETIALKPLTLRLDGNGAFAREISMEGEEIFRGIGFVVRDANWGTPPLLAEAAISRSDNSASVQSSGSLNAAGGDLSWSTQWTITNSGLVASARATSVNAFATN